MPSLKGLLDDAIVALREQTGRDFELLVEHIREPIKYSERVLPKDCAHTATGRRGLIPPTLLTSGRVLGWNNETPLILEAFPHYSTSPRFPLPNCQASCP